MQLSTYWIITFPAARGFVTGLSFLVAVLLAFAAHAGDQEAVEVISGDMLRVGDRPYCLRGIDAPELGQICRRANGRNFDCGHIAKTALMDLTAGAKVTCTPVDENSSCTIANCHVDGFSLSQNMVHTGWALSTVPEFARVQANAKRKQHGLWKGRFDEPLVWRNRSKMDRDKR